MTLKFIVDLEPIGRRIEIEEGATLLDAAHKAGIDLVAACGGVGICGTCVVHPRSGKFSPLTQNEEDTLLPEQISAGFRLACQVRPLSDVKVEIPPESLVSSQQMQVEGKEDVIRLIPNVIGIDIQMEKPDIDDLRSDLTRTNQTLAKMQFPPLNSDLNGLARLSKMLRKENWTIRLAISPNEHQSRLVTSLPKKTRLLGMASDMGSTKLAVYLVDLESGATLAQTGVMNPQISYGEDVVSRIAFANKNEENRKLLQSRLVQTLNHTLETLCQQVGVSIDQVVDAVVVGNTAMHHFFCGLPVEQLGEAPYVPSVSEALSISAHEIGLALAGGAAVYLPPNIAGYVGGDHTSVLLATQTYSTPKTMVMVDIGTNTEISIVHKGNVYSCSTASGPAFEGAHIRDGMRASEGAIESVTIQGSEVQPKTIGNVKPIGICGTGILKGISEMLNNRIIDERGVLDKQHPRVRTIDRGSEFLLVEAKDTGHGRDIVITRRDVNEIQLAKGAIRAGIEILMREAGVMANQVDEWIIAGAFGTYLDLNSALRIGMFPNVPLDRFRQVGNAAGVGAKQMLLSKEKREEAKEVVKGINYIELTTYPGFTKTYTDAMYFNFV